MEQALTAYLLARPALAAMVGQRITWAGRPQGSALPAIVLHLIDRLPQYTMGGTASVTPQRIQVDVWSKDSPGVSGFATVKDLARELSAALSGVAMTVNGIAFLGSFKEGERDSFEQGSAGEALYRVSQDFIIWTRED